MADWYALHLTLDPPATGQQLSALHDALIAIDYDAPVKHIGPSGTFAGPDSSFSGANKLGEAWSLWRSPMLEIQDRLPHLCAAAGLSGHGWLKHTWDDEDRWRPVPDSERFTFGPGQDAMRARIEWDTERARLSSLFYRCRTSLLEAADRGDDAALVACAESLREARHMLEAHEDQPPAGAGPASQSSGER